MPGALAWRTGAGGPHRDTLSARPLGGAPSRQWAPYWRRRQAMKKTIAPNEPGMPRTAQLHQGQRRSRPAAERSDEGNLSEDALAADPYGEGLSGIPPLEAEATNQDILPDQV